MDIQFTEDQKRFRDEVRKFIRDRLPDDIRRAMSNGAAASFEQTRRWHRILNERGWAAPHWPKEYGGCGYGAAERLILQDELYLAPAPLPMVRNTAMLGPVLIAYGTEKQKAWFLPKLASLDLWFCQGFSEPGAGSDLASLRCSAELRGDTYRVNGQKIWTSSAHVADWIFCLVRTSKEERKQEGITFLLIDLKSPGITIRPIHSIDGEHHFNEVFFDNVEVPVENRVGKEGGGWECAKYVLQSERLVLAHVGMCRERLNFARVVLAEKPHLSSSFATDLALLEVETRALEITQWRMVYAEGRSEAQGMINAAALKLKGVEIQQGISALLQKIAGCDSLEQRASGAEHRDHWSAALSTRYLRLRAASIFGGTSEIQKEILSKELLGRL